MTIHPPQTEEQLLSPQRSGAATPPSRRVADYRLRGLDLDAPALAETPARRTRTRHPSLGRRRWRLLIQWVVVLTVTASVAVLLRTYVVQPFAVRSTSMVPTLQAGTEVLVVKSSRLTGPIKVGDIVVFHEPRSASCGTPGDHSHRLVKRVIGLSGQTIWSAGGSIYIDGRPLDEPGWYNPPFGELGPTNIVRTKIPAGAYFVMGDNRTDSCDSRSFGSISRSSLIGRVVATLSRDGHLFAHSV